MRAVLTKVKHASVTIDGEVKGKIGKGFLILLGVAPDDTEEKCRKMADKLCSLRIFDDENGALNLSAEDLGYEALVVSNFTLYADTKKGKRPGFTRAAKPPVSVDCYNEVVGQMKRTRLAGVQTGEFGAEMHISLVNEGPITIVIDTDEWAAKGE